MQDDALTGQVSSVDVATKQNLDDLVKAGENLLKKPVARVNLDTGVYEASNHETNEAALIRYILNCDIFYNFFSKLIFFSYHIKLMENIIFLQVCKITFGRKAPSPCEVPRWTWTCTCTCRYHQSKNKWC